MLVEQLVHSEQREQREEQLDPRPLRYDDFIEETDEFPWAGYDRVLEFVVREAYVDEGMSVLEIGAGTGNLTERLVDLHCDVWVVDVSSRVLDEVSYRVRGEAHTVHADILTEWPPELNRRFDRIISTYLFHEWDMATKVALLQRLATQHLTPDGFILIGDVAFRSTSALEEGQRCWPRRWNENMNYWAADEAVIELMEAGLDADYTQVSGCAGVFEIEPY
jgi:putative AdoMet-dependent methyltransferase